MRIALARALGRHLVRVMPQSRADWALGMQAEVEAIDDPGTALGFALGCVATGYTRRFRTVSGLLAAIRWAVAVVTLMFSALVFTNVGWAVAMGSPDIVPQVLGGLGLAFLAAGLTLVRSAPGSLAVLAAMMLALNTLALWATGQTALPHPDFLRALVVEGYLLWSMLLLAALALRHAARSPRLAELARAHGWTG